MTLARLALAATTISALARPAEVSAEAEWVLLPANAQLYMHPDQTSSLDESKDADEPYVNLRKINELPSGWIELETATDNQRHCYPGVDTVKVRLYARSDAISPVIRRQTSLRFSDGTFLMFMPGTPVQPEPGSNPHHIIADGFGFSVILPQDAIGRAYRPVKGLNTPNHPSGPTYEGSFEYDGRRKVQVLDDKLHISKPGKGLLTLHGQCGTYRLRYWAGREVQRGAMTSIFGRDSALSPTPYLPKETLLYWRDGSVAGQLVNDQVPQFGLGQRSCFRHRIGRAEALLCADKGAIVDVEAAIDDAVKTEKARSR